MDYSNSRGAVDMGMVPNLGPGYHASSAAGMSAPQMLADENLEVLWVVGANPLEKATLASKEAFLVVQDMFLTETAQKADVVLPSASAYEKDGTVTSTCGEVQRLKKAVETMGTKPDLQIIALIARQLGVNLGKVTSDSVFDEIRQSVRGYNVPLPVIATGGAAQTMPVNGRVPVDALSGLVQSARDTLFTSGSLGRYSKMLNSVAEAPGGLYR